MSEVLTRIAVWLNVAADPLGRRLLAPVRLAPGWLSLTVISAVTGVLLLGVFKYTSNQRAIKRVRADIKANLLALKLFRDSLPVSLRAQGAILVGAGRLLVLALVPMLVMFVPVSLLLAQLALWYENRPLQVGEEAVLTLRLRDDARSSWPDIRLEPSDAFEVALGPVRILSQRTLCWSIRPRTSGYHKLRFRVGDAWLDKELASGDGFLRVSTERPGWQWTAVVLHPGEEPFGSEGQVASIAIDYPERSAWLPLHASWILYWFVVSLVAAFCFRPLLGVSV